MSKKIRNYAVLTAWMEEAGLRQSDLAARLGVTRQAVFRWCRGTTAPSPELAIIIEHLSYGRVKSAAWDGRSWTTGVTPASEALARRVKEEHSSVAGIARRVGIPQRTFARYVAGESTPRETVLYKINKVLKLKLKREDFYLWQRLA